MIESRHSTWLGDHRESHTRYGARRSTATDPIDRFRFPRGSFPSIDRQRAIQSAPISNRRSSIVSGIGTSIVIARYRSVGIAGKYILTKEGVFSIVRGSRYYYFRLPFVATSLGNPPIPLSNAASRRSRRKTRDNPRETGSDWPIDGKPLSQPGANAQHFSTARRFTRNSRTNYADVNYEIMPGEAPTNRTIESKSRDGCQLTIVLRSAGKSDAGRPVAAFTVRINRGRCPARSVIKVFAATK